MSPRSAARSISTEPLQAASTLSPSRSTRSRVSSACGSSRRYSPLSLRIGKTFLARNVRCSRKAISERLGLPSDLTKADMLTSIPRKPETEKTFRAGLRVPSRLR